MFIAFIFLNNLGNRTRDLYTRDILVSLLHVSLLGADKVAIGDLLQPLLGSLAVNGAANTLGSAEDLPKLSVKSVDQIEASLNYLTTPVKLMELDLGLMIL